jgi:hypothetical protein
MTGQVSDASQAVGGSWKQGPVLRASGIRYIAIERYCAIVANCRYTHFHEAEGIIWIRVPERLGVGYTRKKKEIDRNASKFIIRSP